MPGSPRDDSTAWGCPAWWEAESSHLDAEAARRPGPLPGGAQPAQPFHQHRVGGEGLGTVEQRVEHLVVARGGHVEQLTDGLLLGARELPPLPFEGEDGSVALRQLAGDRRGTGQCPRYLHRQLPRLARAWELTPLSFWHGRPTDCRRTHTTLLGLTGWGVRGRAHACGAPRRPGRPRSSGP